MGMLKDDAFRLDNLLQGALEEPPLVSEEDAHVRCYIILFEISIIRFFSGDLYILMIFVPIRTGKAILNPRNSALDA
jgi:hypothetical protein